MPAKKCVGFLSDLIFESKIRSTAGVFNVEFKSARSLGDFEKNLDECSPEWTIIDLNATRSDVLEAVGLAKRHASAPRVLAFCSHLDSELMESARQAGADDVWPRSQLASQLPLVFGGKV